MKIKYAGNIKNQIVIYCYAAIDKNHYYQIDRVTAKIKNQTLIQCYAAMYEKHYYQMDRTFYATDERCATKRRMADPTPSQSLLL